MWKGTMKKLVFITGGNRGIGKEIVRQFHQANYLVAFSYKSRESEASALSKQLGEDVISVQMDQSHSSSVANALKLIKDHFQSQIDILINNAAMADEKHFEKISENDWSKMLNVNLQGPFLLCQSVIDSMVSKSWGRIINITSIGGQWGGLNQVHYAASKAGLISLTRSMARIYSKDKITTNAIAIGLVDTEMTANELMTEEGKLKVSQIPVGRLGTPTDVAKIALFLASEDAAYVSGQTINANGGMYFD